MRPHELPPLTVFADHLPVREGADDALNVCDFLAEPRKGSAEWGAACVRRIIGVSTGPIAVGIRKSAVRTRLEHAGWFVAARDENLAEAREHCWIRLPDLRRVGLGYGSPRPSLVLVGDRVTRSGQLPFTSKMGVWLLLTIRALGYDELAVYLCNAKDLRGNRETDRLRAVQLALGGHGADAIHWIGLGNQAQSTLRVAKIPHAKVCHPSHHRRFKYSEDVAGYAARFLDAGVPLGPYAEHEPLHGLFYTREVDSLPVLPAPYDLRTLQPAAQPPAERNSGPEIEVMNPVHRERARRAFVTGEAGSLAEAARLAGTSVDRVRKIAKDDNWRAEREDHHRQVTERAKREAERTEAKAIADTRSLAWKAVQLGMTDVVERLSAARGSAKDLERLEEQRTAHDDPGARPLHPNPAGLECLTRVALNLSSAGLGEIDAERERVQSLPLGQLAQETLKVLKDQFGEI